MKYMKTETFKKYYKDNMLSVAWMDGASFGKFLDEWNGKYAAILTDRCLMPLLLPPPLVEASRAPADPPEGEAK